MNQLVFRAVALTSLVFVLGCDGADDTSSPEPKDEPVDTSPGGTDETTPPVPEDMPPEDTPVDPPVETVDSGHVFTMSNDAAINELIVFERDETGALTEAESLPTGGLGSGDGLGSQGALTLSPDGEYIYLVNPGSHQISSFRIYSDHIALVDLVDSGGQRPISVTAGDEHVYVVNAGGDGGVRGFSTHDGVLTPIASASRSLSQIGGTAPAQIGLSPSGNAVIVTEKATNNLVTYWAAPDGSISAPVVTASSGVTPFGFDYSATGMLLVAEAFGGMPGMAAATSYDLAGVEPTAISASVQNSQTASCWLVIAQGKYAYASNTASNTISGYGLSDDGSIWLFDDNGRAADLGDGNRPLDMALGGDDKFLYVLNGESNTVVGLTIEDGGELDEMPDAHPVPPTSVGLIAR